MSDPLHDANVALFDEAAATWDEKPLRIELSRAVTAAIARQVPLASTMEALEFGCGTGLLTVQIAPQVGTVTAVDTSAGMLEVLARKIDELKLANVRALRLDLLRDALPAESFDLIYSSMTLHHIADLSDLLARLTGLLRPGGFLAAADLEPEDGTFHSDAAGVAHLGVDPEALAADLAGRGLADCRIGRAHVIRKEGTDSRQHDYPVFLLTARKP